MKNHVKSSQIIFDGIKCIFSAVCRSVVFSLVLWCASCRTNIWMCALSKLSHLSFALRIFLFHYQSMLHIRVMSLGLFLSQCKCSPRAVYTQKHHCTTDRMTWHFYLHVTVSGGCCTTRNAKVHFPLLHFFSIFHAVECFVPRLRYITWMQPLGSTASNDNNKKVRNKEINNRHTLGIKFNRNCHSDFFFCSTARRIKLVEYFRVNIRNRNVCVSLSFSLTAHKHMR